MPTINLAAISSAETRENSPYNTFHPNVLLTRAVPSQFSTGQTPQTNQTFAYIKFATLPSDIQGAVITAATVYVYVASKSAHSYHADYLTWDWKLGVKSFWDNRVTSLNIDTIEWDDIGRYEYRNWAGVSFVYNVVPVNSYVASNMEYAEASLVNTLRGLTGDGGAVIVSELYNSAGQSNEFMQFQINSEKIANPPYITISYSFPTPAFSNNYPSGNAFVDAHKARTFSWNFHEISNLFGQIQIASGTLSYREVGTTPTTDIAITGMSHDFPASTFTPGKNYEWDVIVTTSQGVTSQVSAWEAFNTKDTLSNPVAISPKNTFVDGALENTFAWEHVISTGSTQTGAELQWKMQSDVNWQPLISVIGASETVVIPINTFTISGNASWRVNTKNTEGTLGNWSDPLDIIIQAVISPPIISGVTPGKARPIISWNSVGQQAYEIEITKDLYTYKSGIVQSHSKEHQVTDYLNDTEYSARMRVYDNEGFASLWTDFTFSVITVKPVQPVITVTDLVNAVTMNITAVGVKGYIIRDEIPIARLYTWTPYIDNTAAAEHTYVFRIIDENDNFNDSAPVTANPTLENFILSQDGVDLILTMNISAGFSSSFMVSQNHIFGQRYSNTTISQFADGSGNLTFRFKYDVNFVELQTLGDMFQNPKDVLLRTPSGTEFYGGLTGANNVEYKEYQDITFSVTRGAHDGRIAYDPV